MKCRQLKQQVMRPLIEYFLNARQAAGVTARDIKTATGKSMASHWLSASQWQLPGEDDYRRLQALFERVARGKNQCNDLGTPHHALQVSYQHLSRQYAALAAEYQLLRRPSG